MKIIIIHGQNHKGSTYWVSRKLAEKVGGDIREFFLPRDFDQPCLGCYTCFHQELSDCPHYEKLKPLAEALLEAEYQPYRSQLQRAGLSERKLRRMDPNDRVRALERAKLNPYDFIFLAC